MNRRSLIKSSSLVFLGLSTPGLTGFKSHSLKTGRSSLGNDLPKHFPNIDPEVISDVVGKSHFDLEGVKELVDQRPELAKSVWEWRFGDFESAIGAASHVGRRDIAFYLISKGARPTIFTFAMLGNVDVMKAIVTANPGIQKTTGPHGISLLDHAYAGERMKDQMSTEQVDNVKRTIDYLESLGDAGGVTYQEVSPEEKKRYIGDYKYGTEPNEGFSIKLNMRDMLSLGPIGGFGGALYKIDEHTFTYNGAPSVTISFDVQEGEVKSLTLSGPEITLRASKVS